ncbi:retrovirus-related Pol polyprotein from transposon 412 [Trichonephila clavipes]|nr:retrovirus-related Pol polyprotein from transposon 412 [Trichonephila clavipes]
MDQDKTAAIQNVPSPRNLKQLQSFYRPAHDKVTIIRTDASSHALGADLLQGESSTDEQPIEYANRLNSSAKRNYSTTEREALAVDWALNKFRGIY